MIISCKIKKYIPVTDLSDILSDIDQDIIYISKHLLVPTLNKQGSKQV